MAVAVVDMVAVGAMLEVATMVVAAAEAMEVSLLLVFQLGECMHPHVFLEWFGYSYGRSLHPHVFWSGLDVLVRLVKWYPG